MEYQKAVENYIVTLQLFVKENCLSYKYKILLFLRDKIGISNLIPRKFKTLNKCQKCGATYYCFLPFFLLSDMKVCTTCKTRFVLHN